MSQRQQTLQYVLAYLLWAVSTVFGLLVMNIGREMLTFAIVFAGSRGEQTASEQFYLNLRARAANNWSILVMGVLVIILMVGLEHYFRTAVPDGSVWPRFFKVMAITCSVLLIIHVIYLALQLNFRPFQWWMAAIPLVEALVMILFWRLWASRRNLSIPSRT